MLITLLSQLLMGLVLFDKFIISYEPPNHVLSNFSSVHCFIYLRNVMNSMHTLLLVLQYVCIRIRKVFIRSSQKVYAK